MTLCPLISIADPPTQPPPPVVIIPTIPIYNPNLVLEQPLSEYSQNQLFCIRYADSCTLDPHKAGFAPYPAGSLCYRDERLRFMVTMTAAYINTTADMDNVGTYGVEGRFVHVSISCWTLKSLTIICTVNLALLQLVFGWHITQLVSVTEVMVPFWERRCTRP